MQPFTSTSCFFFVGILILSSKKIFATYTDYANNALCAALREDLWQYLHFLQCTQSCAPCPRCQGALNIGPFSAFRFENFMKTLKKMVRKSQSSCSQVVKRILERGTTPVPRVVGLGLRREYVNGPLPALFPDAVQYSVYKQSNSH